MIRRLFWLLIPFIALLIDWGSKQWILARFRPGELQPVIQGFFNLTLGFNSGAIFGVLSSAPNGVRQGIFLLAGLGALAYFGYEFLKADTPNLQRIALGLILGGALGNGLDRIVHGAVVDFLDFVFFGWHYWTFNIADSCIVCGAILMGLSMLIHKPKAEPQPAKTVDEDLEGNR